jgi:superfamily II DNA or RNA helicase
MSFTPGQIVYHANSPSRRGVITGRTRKMGPVTAWEVVYSANDKTYIPANVLVAVEIDEDTLEKRIAAGRFGRPDDLRRRMTFEKLKGSLSEFIYSMDAAEIDFLEYQFKPVLKFVESPNERLLLADEVGLGKTIEAALIWLEMQARRDARRLLVVCPKMLVRNWRTELRGKFNVPVEECTVKQLGDHMRDLKATGPTHRFALIATYSSIRASREDFADLDTDEKLSVKGELVRVWDRWDEDYPFADLVIFDEAHTMRNAGALVSRTGSALSNAAEGILCVSATPVNNRSEDLRTLLRLLDPGMFDDEFLFNQLLAENAPAVRLGNALAVLPPKLAEARAALPELRASGMIGKSELLPRLEEMLRGPNALSHENLIEAQRLAEQLNVLGRYVARTRRRQVAEMRAERKPMVVPVIFNDMEFKFYWAITRLVRQRVERAGNRFSAFHLVGPQLRMASCIPAMVDAYRSGQLGDFEDVLFDEFELDGDDSAGDSAPTDDGFKDFLNKYRAYDFEANDSKYARFQDVVLNKLGNEKIVVFSFFRGTLSYLQKRLNSAGVDTATIHGGMTQQSDRDAEIERFAQPDGPRVLLSSEVGSEGINLQFARVVINYDLPWNPMRVEQRIGRIDRVGQQAAVLHVVHFKVHGTIEERLYDKLHAKLEIFRNSLGDLEAVIGEEVAKLTGDLFRRDLTPDEEENRIKQTELVLASRLKAQDDLEQSGQNLLGLSDYIRDRINRNRQLGRYVTPEELRSYIDDFFRRCYQGCRLSWNDPSDKVFRLDLTMEAHERLLAFLADVKQDAAPEQRARNMVGTLHVEVGKRRLKYEGRRIVLINHLSPLIRWITRENQNNAKAFFDTAALRIREPKMPPGAYVFRIERWSFKGLRKREVLSYAVAHLNGGPPAPAEQAEAVIQRLLLSGDDWLHRDVDAEQTTGRLEVIRDSLSDRHHTAYETFAAENQNLQLIQRQQVISHFERRTRQDEQRLATLIQNNRSEKMQKLGQARLDNTRQRRDEKLRDLKQKAEIDQHLEEIAAGVFINEP